MKVHIIGNGVVGKATGQLFERFGHEVVYTDKGDAHGAVRAVLHFICVPEAAAPEIVRELAKDGHYVADRGNANSTRWLPKLPFDEYIVIRSSVPPGTTLELAMESGRPLFHNPEFLREATAGDDTLHADHVLIGAAMKEGDGGPGGMHALFHLYQDCGKDVWVVGSSTETELLKLVSNSYLATLISFWNEVAQLADKLGLNSHHLGRWMVRNDPRINRYGALKHGDPYGGKCLPKDIAQLIGAAEKLQSPALLLRAVENVNASLAGEADGE